MSELERIHKEAARLSADEKARLAQMLLDEAALTKSDKPRTSNIERLRGTLKLDEDPLKIQERLRQEWH